MCALGILHCSLSNQERHASRLLAIATVIATEIASSTAVLYKHSWPIANFEHSLLLQFAFVTSDQLSTRIDPVKEEKEEHNKLRN